MVDRKKTILDQVHDAVKTHPGLTARQIGQIVNITHASTQTHLYRLRQQGRVRSYRNDSLMWNVSCWVDAALVDA